MRTIILAAGAALILSVQVAAVAKADETTVIRHDHPDDSSTTVIKKREGVDLLPIPHPTEEKKVIIHRDHDE
jgi:hypothetical protein